MNIFKTIFGLYKQGGKSEGDTSTQASIDKYDSEVTKEPVIYADGTKVVYMDGIWEITYPNGMKRTSDTDPQETGLPPEPK